MALIRCDFYSDALNVSTSMTVLLPEQTRSQIGLAGAPAADAAGFLAPSSPCDQADLESAYVPADGFVTLVGVRIAQARALVDVSVTGGSAALLPAEWSEEHTLTLTREDGHWLLSGTPWPVWDCVTDVR